MQKGGKSILGKMRENKSHGQGTARSVRGARSSISEAGVGERWEEEAEGARWESSQALLK